MSVLHPRIHKTFDVGKPPSPPIYSTFKCLQIHYHGFTYLPHARGREIKSPRFLLNGHQWELGLYPGGELHARSSRSSSSYVSIRIRLCSKGGVKAKFVVKILTKFGDTSYKMQSPPINWNSDSITEWGWPNAIKRSKILDESMNILDDDGTLAIVVSVQEDAAAALFVPNNPFLKMIKGMFLDEETADVCFEVCTAEGKEDDDGTKRVKTSTPFYAHRLILNKCAPMLAALFDSKDTRRMTSAPISDVNPDIFRHLLCYVYGGGRARRGVENSCQRNYRCC